MNRPPIVPVDFTGYYIFGAALIGGLLLIGAVVGFAMYISYKKDEEERGKFSIK